MFRSFGVLALAGFNLTACSPSQPLRTDVLLISLDTLRRDAVGLYSRDGESLTPAIDAFARDSVIFTHSFAPIPFTLPSHMTMFTGFYPDVHAVSSGKSLLAREFTTLPEILQRANYSTAGFVTNDWMKGEFGFARGFERFERLKHGLTFADRVNRRAFEVLDNSAADRPFFLFLHYFDAHSDFHHPGGNTLPYYAPEPYHRAEMGAQPFTYDFCDEGNNCATKYLIAADRERRPLSSVEIEKVYRLYRAGVRYLDDQLANLFDGLKRRRLYDSSLIVLVSDHGEEFREHGRFIHGQTYDENIAVPLLIKLPYGRYRGTMVDGLVEHTDLLPTLLDFLNVTVDIPFQGTSLVPLIEGRASGKRVVLSEDKFVPGRYALRSSRYKLIFDTGSKATELYDLASDPRERTNLSGERPRLVAGMRARLLQVLEKNSELAARVGSVGQVDEVLDEAEQERLRSLGYLQ